MRKVTKKSIKNKLDKVCSEIIRAQGFCAKCRESRYEKLQCAHIFSRSNLAVRWDLKNMLPLCGGCHLFWAHKNPVGFTEFVKIYLGEFEYLSLIQRANVIKKWTIQGLQELYKELLKIKEGVL